MKLNNRILALILVILATITLLLLFFVFKGKNAIEVENTSNYFKVGYSKSQSFEDALREWKIWDKNSVKLKSATKTHTISKIIVKATDEASDNFSYRQVRNAADQSPLANFDYELNSLTQTATVLVYFNSEDLSQDGLEFLRITLATGILKTLYENRVNAMPEDGFRDLLQAYIKSPSTNPFTITLPDK